MNLVINRKLNGHHREVFKLNRARRFAVSILKIEIHDQIPMDPIG
jgi:hypothetical protein